MSLGITIGIGLILVGLVGLLFLRLRLRVALSSGKRELFVGIGRSGAELDFASGMGFMRLFGWRLRSFSLSDRITKKKKADKTKAEVIKKKPEVARERPLGKIIEIVKHSINPLWRWFVGMVRACKIEQMEGRLAGGFDSPEYTGQAYGLYCALIGSVPALSGRLYYEPNWNESSFDADFKAALALPVYSLVGQSLRLISRLPLIRIVKMAIGNRKKKR